MHLIWQRSQETPTMVILPLGALRPTGSYDRLRKGPLLRHSSIQPQLTGWREGAIFPPAAVKHGYVFDIFLSFRLSQCQSVFSCFHVCLIHSKESAPCPRKPQISSSST